MPKITMARRRCTLANNAGVAEMLLRHGAAVDAIDNDGQTPLHLAAETLSFEPGVWGG